MLASARLPLATLAIAWAASLLACVGDDEVTSDAAPPVIDSGTPDAPGTDAEDLCPGELTFEALVADLESDTAVFEVTVAEVGNETNAASSAPNGRAVLCLPADAASTVRSTKTDHLDRLDRVDPEVTGALAAAAVPSPLHVITAAAADALLGGLGVTRDPAEAQVVVSVLAAADGQPIAGATVALDKAHEGAFARDARGGFAAGDAVGAGGLVLFANVSLTGSGQAGEVEATVTLPDDFDGTGTCTGGTADIEAGALTGVLLVCE